MVYPVFLLTRGQLVKLRLQSGGFGAGARRLGGSLALCVDLDGRFAPLPLLLNTRGARSVALRDQMRLVRLLGSHQRADGEDGREDASPAHSAAQAVMYFADRTWNTLRTCSRLMSHADRPPYNG